MRITVGLDAELAEQSRDFRDERRRPAHEAQRSPGRARAAASIALADAPARALQSSRPPRASPSAAARSRPARASARSSVFVRELARRPRAVEHARSRRAAARSAWRSIARSGAIPVPPAMKTKAPFGRLRRKRETAERTFDVDERAGARASDAVRPRRRRPRRPAAPGSRRARHPRRSRRSSRAAAARARARRSATRLSRLRTGNGWPSRSMPRRRARAAWPAARRGSAASAARRHYAIATRCRLASTRPRGALLRLVRRRRLSIVLGLVAGRARRAGSQFGGRFDAWWVEGLSLVAGATGLALFWTGLTGAESGLDRRRRLGRGLQIQRSSAGAV